MREKTRVVIVDDYPSFREGVAELLGAAPDTLVVGLGSTAQDAAQLAADLQPDLLLLDLDMPGGGLNAARAVANCCPAVKVVILTVSHDEEDLAQALQAGVRAYVLKGVSGRDLRRILRSVQAGEHYLTPALVPPGAPSADGKPSPGANTQGSHATKT